MVKKRRLLTLQWYLLGALAVPCILAIPAVLFLWMGQTAAPDFDHIATSLTVLQIIFGIAGVYGFWTLRGLTCEVAKDTATEAATEEARSLVPDVTKNQLDKLLPQMLPQIVAPMVGRSIKEYTSVLESGMLDADVDILVEAFSGEGKEDGDGK